MPALADRARRVAHRRLVERLELGSVRLDAPADLEDVLGRHRPLRLDPGEQARARRGTSWRPISSTYSEARGGDERGARALALEDQVGGDRRAVQHARDVGARRARERCSDLGDAVAEAVRGVVGRRGRLGGPRRGPSRGSSSVTSVKVPPVSMPIDDGGRAIAVLAISRARPGSHGDGRASPPGGRARRLRVAAASTATPSAVSTTP